MSPFSLSAVLLGENEYISVEVELGELTPAPRPQRGRSPVGCAGAARCRAKRQGQDAQLRFSDGQQRSVRLTGVLRTDDEGHLIVVFLGKGTPPVGSCR